MSTADIPSGSSAFLWPPFEPAGTGVVLREISWETYQSLRASDANQHLRMTYDRGQLEIKSPSKKHEQISYLIGRMIDEWTMLRYIEIHGGRSTTFSRQDLEKGLEPDNCYWIANEAKVRDRDVINLAIDPPPDLVLEIDVTSALVPKLPIYQALGVPEVWRCHSETLAIVVLGASGYSPSAGSHCLPDFPLSAALELLRDRRTMGNNALLRRFRQMTGGV